MGTQNMIDQPRQNDGAGSHHHTEKGYLPHELGPSIVRPGQTGAYYHLDIHPGHLVLQLDSS